METTIQKGSNYISAIFQVLLQESNKKETLIEPQYIFRGITKRWFSTSILIENNKNEIIKSINRFEKKDSETKALYPECQKWLEQHSKELSEPDKMKSNDLYEFMYKRLKHAINIEETKTQIKRKKNQNKDDHQIESIKLLEKMMNLNTSKKNNSTIHNDYKYCVPEYINSGAVVRLKKGDPDHPSNLEYVNYIKHMLNDIKIRFPEYNGEELSDIEILADVQHKGAATCLADFSTNFLTTLWFATQDYNEDIGFLFCYDINKALIQTDKLFILNNNNVKRSIEELLYETSKNNRQYRNWLWRPSNLNERIAMQDSIFIFGLEPFNILENEIIAIPIPPDWKNPIQHALKSFFGITAESIYCDVEGYADANSKTRPYTKTFMHYFNDKYGLMPQNESTQSSDSNKQEKHEYSMDYLQCGMDCLFQGEYELALEYFKSYKAKTGNDFKQLDKEDYDYSKDSDFYLKLKQYILSVDVMYSKAICLKHTDDELGAVIFLKNTIDRCKVLQKHLGKWKDFSKNDTSIFEEYAKYLEIKENKAFNDLIGAYFATNQYHELLKELTEKIDELKEKIDELNQGANGLNDKIIKYIVEYIFYLLKNREAQCCCTLMESSQYNTGENLKDHFEYLKSIEYDLKEMQPLLFVLSKFFDEIQEILIEENDEIFANNDASNDEYHMSKKECEKDDKIDFKTARRFYYINSDIEYTSPNLYSNWDLKNIEKLIQKMLDTNKRNKYENLRDSTDKMHDFITFIQSKIKPARS